MIDKWSVLDAVKLGYYHTLSDSELLPCCEAAARELTVKLREDADEGDIRLLNLAAAMANYTVVLKGLAGEDGITSFKAGDVSITKGGAHADAVAHAQVSRAMLAALPLLKDDGFHFAGIEI